MKYRSDSNPHNPNRHDHGGKRKGVTPPQPTEGREEAGGTRAEGVGQATGPHGLVYANKNRWTTQHEDTTHKMPHESDSHAYSPAGVTCLASVISMRFLEIRPPDED